MASPWSNLGLHKWITETLNELNIKTPTPVQESCIPEILKGRDCIGCAKTGSGKTAAFSLPIIQKLSEDPYGVFALVLTSSRELALQISEQIEAFGKPINIRVTLVVGGEGAIMQSVKMSQKPHVVVATPGRLASLLKNNSQYFHLKRLAFLVLDEVDALLEPGDMERDLGIIVDVLPPASTRQTLAFSATSDGIVRTLKELLNKNAYFYNEIKEISTVDQLSQNYLLVPQIAKDAYIVHLLQIKLGLSIQMGDDGKVKVVKDEKATNCDRQAIVFTPSCWQCHILSLLLTRFGFKCSSLHSALTQHLRNESLSKFRSRHNRILVATSLAGRGLDIPTVDLVINYSLPISPEEYIHRVGRTARAGKYGTSISFVVPYELNRLISIEEHIGNKLTEYKFENPSEAEKLIKSCALIRKEISTHLYYDDDSRLNRKVERNKKKRKQSASVQT